MTHKQIMIAQMKSLVQTVMNSLHHQWTIANREAYLNNAWRLIKRYEKEREDDQ